MGVRQMRKGVVVAFSVFLSVAIVGLTLLSAAWIARDCAMPQRVDAALRAFCAPVAEIEPPA